MADSKSSGRWVANLYVLAVLGIIRVAASALRDPIGLWIQRGAVGLAIIVVILAFVEMFRSRSICRRHPPDC